MSFQKKYLKYKNKYFDIKINLNNMKGGGVGFPNNCNNQGDCTKDQECINNLCMM